MLGRAYERSKRKSIRTTRFETPGEIAAFRRADTPPAPLGSGYSGLYEEKGWENLVRNR